MKIHPDQLEGVRSDQQQGRTNQTRQTEQAFADILSREVSHGLATGQVAPTGTLPELTAVNPALQIQAVNEAAPAAEVTARVDQMLDSVQDYADALGDTRDPQSLRQAYAALDSLERDVQQLKDEFPDLAQRQPGLQSLVDELEVLSATEKFKFNRGDYI